MRRRRVMFCGALNGHILPLPGESDEAAIRRAEDAMHALVDRHAKRFGLVFGLEPDNVGQEQEDEKYERPDRD